MKTVPLEPVTYEELLARAVANQVWVPEIRRDFVPTDDPKLPSDDLFVDIHEIKRVNPFNKGTASSNDTYPFPRALTFAGAKDSKLCWVWDEEVVGKGEKRIRAEAEEVFSKFHLALYAVDDLAVLKGPISSELPDAGQVAWINLLSTDLDNRDERYGMLETCAQIPAITARTSHLVIAFRSRTPPATTMETLSGASPEDLKLQRDRERFGGNGLLIWKLVGEAGAAVGTPPPPPADKPTPPGLKPTPATGKTPEGKAGGKAGGKMSLAKASVAAGTTVRVTFDGPMKALPGEKYWITIVDAAAGPTAYTSYKYLDPDATSIDLAAPAVAGDYEVRLHGNYPTQTYNLLLRTKLTVR